MLCHDKLVPVKKCSNYLQIKCLMPFLFNFWLLSLRRIEIHQKLNNTPTSTTRQLRICSSPFEPHSRGNLQMQVKVCVRSSRKYLGVCTEIFVSQIPTTMSRASRMRDLSLAVGTFMLENCCKKALVEKVGPDGWMIARTIDINPNLIFVEWRKAIDVSGIGLLRRIYRSACRSWRIRG